MGEQQRKLLAHGKGESDLVYRNGKLYLYATCEIPEASVVAPNGFLGVDLGIVNVATTSDGTRHAGKHLNRIRRRNQRLRAKLQGSAAGSGSASPSGPRCTPGPSTNSAPSSATRRCGPES